MSYTITLSNGNILTTVPDTQLVTTFGGTTLIGKDAAGFGTALNNNLVRIIEHSANNTPPTNPLVGQIWYDNISNAINFWNGIQWQTVGIITSSATAPLDPQEGDEWYDTINQQLNIWNGFEWILIGPPNQGGINEGFVVGTFPTGAGNVYYLQLYANNELMGIVSSVELVNPGFIGFGNIRPGFNFVTNPQSAPTIVSSGIYNPSEVTIGDSDQTSILNDPYDNTVIGNNDGAVIIASNGNSSALSYASDSNVFGTVFFNTISANNYENLPSSVVPGSGGEVMYNDGNSALAAGDILAIDTSTGNVLAAHLIVNNHFQCNTCFANVYENLPSVPPPGSNGQFLYNDSGSLGAAAALTIAGSVITADTFEVTNQTTLNSTLYVNERTTITDSLSLTGTSTAANFVANSTVTTTELVVNDDAEIGNNLNVSTNTTTQTLTVNTSASIGTTLEAGATTVSSINDSGLATVNSLTVNTTSTLKGAVTFNTSSNAFTTPTNNGTVNGGALLTDAAGSTSWGTVNLSAWTQSLVANGYQELPGGLIIQWGSASASGGGPTAVNVTFPLNPFPNNLFSIAFATQDTGPNASRNVVYITSQSTSGFTGQSDSGTVAFSWIAIGN